MKNTLNTERSLLSLLKDDSVAVAFFLKTKLHFSTVITVAKYCFVFRKKGRR